MHWQSGCPGTNATRVQTGDTWLSQLLPKIFASAGYQAGNTLVLITWDEGNEMATTGIDCTTQANIDTSGCHVGLIAASAYITPGTVDATRYTPYSTLAAIETHGRAAAAGTGRHGDPARSRHGLLRSRRVITGSVCTLPASLRARCSH